MDIAKGEKKKEVAQLLFPRLVGYLSLIFNALSWVKHFFPAVFSGSDNNIT